MRNNTHISSHTPIIESKQYQILHKTFQIIQTYRNIIKTGPDITVIAGLVALTNTLISGVLVSLIRSDVPPTAMKPTIINLWEYCINNILYHSKDGKHEFKSTVCKVWWIYFYWSMYNTHPCTTRIICASQNNIIHVRVVHPIEEVYRTP